jgi:hypothetical protein
VDLVRARFLTRGAEEDRTTMPIMSPDVYVAFLQVIMIDLVLAGDNAVVIGLAAAGLPPARIFGFTSEEAVGAS